MEATPTRQRKRKVCSKCGLNLSYAAYTRHQNPMVCPPRSKTGQKPKSSSAAQSAPGGELAEFVEIEDASIAEETTECTSDSSSDHDDSEPDPDNVEIIDEEMDEVLTSACEQTERPEEDSPLTPQQMTCSIQGSDEGGDQGTAQQSPHLHVIATHIALFISFFQLCYKISESGITLLLNFLRAIILWVCKFSNSAQLRGLYDMVPKNVYFLKKMCTSTEKFTEYVVCPKCDSLYNLKDCIISRHGGLLESAKCVYVQYPKHPQVSRQGKCNALLMKRVKHGTSYKLSPRKVYTYNSLKVSLTKLISKHGFLTSCEKWRSRSKSQGVYTDIYDGSVWESFSNTFFQTPHNFGLILNIDWFNPFKHIEYSVGVIYLVVANLPRSERYKIENVIIAGIVPGPKEPRKHMNSYLKPLVDELLELWMGTYVTGPGIFVPIRCALLCVSCDLPATRKVCGFTSFSSLHGCSKCMKTFTCSSFGAKADFSGYDRQMWEMRTHDKHNQQVLKLSNARTATDQQQIEKAYGVRYSELLRLPYFDIVEYHVVDPMHNLLLGTAKYLMNMWKESGVVNRAQFEYIQQEIDDMRVPANVGRIPYKIASNFSSFTADQWKNWVCVYSTVCLKEILPSEHYQCWVLFQDAVCLLLQPSLSQIQVSIADSKLEEFCKAYESLYGKEKCTPNMHMHMHLCKSIQNYGPTPAFWCFPFERFNGILGTFQKNWISPEQQMARKFISYQHLLLMDIAAVLPDELAEFFADNITKCREISLGEGSLVQTHVDSSHLLDYKKSAYNVLSAINATESSIHILYRRYECLLDSSEVESLTTVYNTLYPSSSFHVPMTHERFHALRVFNELLVSQKSKGSQSSAICANWAGVGGHLATDNSLIRVGFILYFIRHTIRMPISSTESKKIPHLFARVSWYKPHPRENWFHHRTQVVSTDFNASGPATFLPVARIRCQCALINKTVKFDYGEDCVNIAIFCGSNFCV